MKRSGTILVILFILILGYVGGSYIYNKVNYIEKENLIPYLQKKVDVGISYDLQLKKECNIDDRHIIIFTFKQGANNMLGYAVFKIASNGKYKYVSFSSSNETTGYRTILTNYESENQNPKSYSIFYGIISDKQPNKYRVVSSGKEYIEEFERDKYFLKVYPIINNSGNSLTPIYD